MNESGKAFLRKLVALGYDPELFKQTYGKTGRSPGDDWYGYQKYFRDYNDIPEGFASDGFIGEDLTNYNSLPDAAASAKFYEQLPDEALLDMVSAPLVKDTISYPVRPAEDYEISTEDLIKLLKSYN